MLDYVASSTVGFWACAFAIVLIDSAVLLKAGEFTFRLRANSGFEVRLPTAPFLVRNHELVFTLVSYFLRPFYLSSIDSQLVPQADRRVELQRVDALYRALSLSAVAGFTLIAAVGPAVSIAWGINIALFSVLPILYANSIAALICVFRNRNALRMTNPDMFRITFELLACPVLTVNIVKRLTMRRNLMLNTWELVGEDRDIRSRIKANLELFDALLAVR